MDVLVVLAAAKLRYRDHEGAELKTVVGMVHVKDSASHFHGRYPLIPNRITHARVHFSIANTSREAIRPLVANVGVVDQYGKEHWLDGLTFKNTDHILDS
jgi:hypothetical protein